MRVGSQVMGGSCDVPHPSAGSHARRLPSVAHAQRELARRTSSSIGRLAVAFARLSIVAVAVLTLSPATAPGSTVKLEPGYIEGDRTSDGEDYDDVTITAAAGERNRLLVTVGEGELIVRDDGAPVVPAARACRRLTVQEARCRLTRDGHSITVRGGDGADRIVVAGQPDWVFLYGGAGDDELRSTADSGAGALLDGRAGDDWLTSGPREDALYGGRATIISRPAPASTSSSMRRTRTSAWSRTGPRRRARTRSTAAPDAIESPTGRTGERSVSTSAPVSSPAAASATCCAASRTSRAARARTG